MFLPSLNLNSFLEFSILSFAFKSVHFSLLYFLILVSTICFAILPNFAMCSLLILHTMPLQLSPNFKFHLLFCIQTFVGFEVRISHVDVKVSFGDVTLSPLPTTLTTPSPYAIVNAFIVPLQGAFVVDPTKISQMIKTKNEKS